MWSVKENAILALLPIEQVDITLENLFSKHQSVKKSTIIYNYNDPSEYVYLIKKGTVRLMKLALDGRQITLSILGRLMIFGEADVLNEATYSHYAETMEPCEICYIHKKDFKNLLEKYGEVKQMILEVMYKDLKHSQQKMTDIAFCDVRTRLIHEIVNLCDLYGKPYNYKNKIGTLLDLKVSQDDLADLVASSRETINRIMHEFKSDDVIDYVDRKLILTREFFDLTSSS